MTSQLRVMYYVGVYPTCIGIRTNERIPEYDNHFSASCSSVTNKGPVLSIPPKDKAIIHR